MIEYIINSIKESEVDTNPFSHIYINGFFEKNFYNNILNFLPHKNEYIPLNKTGLVSENYPPERFTIDINSVTLSKFKGEQNSVFNNIYKAFLSNEFFGAVASKFKKTLDDRIFKFSEDEIKSFGKNNFQFEARISLVKDYTKYQLGAHTDSPRKFLTFLFYLPKDESLKDIGTSLYKPLNSDFKLSYESHYSKVETDKNFEEIKKVPFLPNSVLIFPRTNFSFHGVSSINIGSFERNLLLLNFYFKKI